MSAEFELSHQFSLLIFIFGGDGGLDSSLKVTDTFCTLSVFFISRLKCFYSFFYSCSKFCFISTFI